MIIKRQDGHGIRAQTFEINSELIKTAVQQQNIE
jgi:hypothetical protein